MFFVTKTNRIQATSSVLCHQFAVTPTQIVFLTAKVIIIIIDNNNIGNYSFYDADRLNLNHDTKTEIADAG